MTTLNRPSKNTAAFFLQAAIAFGVSLFGVLGGVLFLPLDLWQRLFPAMTVLFLVTSSFTLAKVIRDQEEAATIRVRLDEPGWKSFWQNIIRSPPRADRYDAVQSSSFSAGQVLTIRSTGTPASNARCAP
jgi:hypothetical protein